LNKIVIRTVSLFLVVLFLIVSFAGCIQSTPSTTSLTTTSTSTFSSTKPAQTSLQSSTVPSTVTSPTPISSTTLSSVSTSTTTSSVPTTSTPVAASTSTSTTSTTTTTTTTVNSGGGETSYYIKATFYGESQKIKTDSQGKIIRNYSYTSKDGKLAITLPAGTVAQNTEGKRLTTLSLENTDSCPSIPAKTMITSNDFVFGPEGATFDPAINLVYTYDPSNISEDINPETLSFYSYDESSTTWLEQASVIDSSAHTITTSVNHFSNYAVLGKTTKLVHSMDLVNQPDPIEVPYHITNILSFGPVETQLLFMLSPEKLGGINSDWNSSWDNAAPYIDFSYPIIGNASQKDPVFSVESALAADPDVQVVIEGKLSNWNKYKKAMNDAEIPYILVNSGSDLLTQYGPEIQYVGDLLNEHIQTQKLLDYYNQAMSDVESIVGSFRSATFSESSEDSDQAVRVYYAENSDGLASDPKGNWHTTLLWYCGGANIAVGLPSCGSGSAAVTKEQILTWDNETPIEMIVLGRGATSQTYEDITDPDSWWYQNLSCVKQGNICIRPQNPTSWFDGPPGYGQILGMYWLVDVLYHDDAQTVFTLTDKIEEFYSEFLHHDLTNAELQNLLSQPGD
jgi:iron complex transport system substrate-binding protein